MIAKAVKEGYHGWPEEGISIKEIKKINKKNSKTKKVRFRDIKKKKEEL